MELFWEPLKLGGRSGPAQGLTADPFQIVPEDPPLAYYTCILKGPDNLFLRCGSIRDALAAAEALAEDLDDDEDDEDDEDDDDEDDEDDDEDDDDTLSFLPPSIAAKVRARRR